MATKKKKIKSHVKYVKQQQKKNPVSEEKYQKRLKVARKKDNMRRLRNFFIILAVLVLALFIGGNVMAEEGNRTDTVWLHERGKGTGR